MVSLDYLSAAQLMEVAGDEDNSTPTDTKLSQRAVTAASRWIDLHCLRHFYAVDTPTARLLHPSTSWLAWTGDFATTTGLIVETADESGTWTTWSAQDWQPERSVTLHGFPYTRVLAVGDRAFPLSRKIRTRVTALWGWAEVPAPIEQACQILAVAYYKSRFLTGGGSGFDDRASVSGEIIGLAEHLVADYQITPTAPVINA